MRCAKCAQVWFQSAPAPDAEIVPEPEIVPAVPPAPEPAAPIAGVPPSTDFGDFGGADVEVEPGDEPPQTEPVRRRRFTMPPPAQIAGWAALILMVIGLGWSAVQYRQTIANLWPESASVYAALGMPVNVRGMALINIAYRQDFEDGQPVLSVTGKVVNISNRELPVPGLRVVLTDDTRRELYRWTFDVGIPTLKAGAESPFVTRLSSPPPDARNLNITFADASSRP